MHWECLCAGAVRIFVALCVNDDTQRSAYTGFPKHLNKKFLLLKSIPSNDMKLIGMQLPLLIIVQVLTFSNSGFMTLYVCIHEIITGSSVHISVFINQCGIKVQKLFLRSLNTACCLPAYDKCTK